METFIGGTIPVVTEEYEFENRDKSKKLNIFKLSDYGEYDGRKDQKICFPKR